MQYSMVSDATRLNGSYNFHFLTKVLLSQSYISINTGEL